MASSSVIGALRIVLGMDSAALEKDVAKAKSTLTGFAADVGKAGAAIGIALGAAVGFAVKGAIDEADKLGKMAQSIGVPVEELSRLKHAADLSDVSVENLGVSVGKLSKNMVAVAGGGGKEAAKAFEALGISVTNADGSLKSSTEVMTEVAGKFGNMEDGAGKTALAIAMFGKSGASMIPMLNDGAEGLNKMMAEADQLGIVIDGKTAKSAEAFNDNLTRLGKVKDGIIQQVTARMLPAFENLTEILLAAAKDTGTMDMAANVLATTLKTLVSGGIIVAATFKALGEMVGAVASAIMFAAKGEFNNAWEALKKGPSDVAATVQGTAGVIVKLWDESGRQIATSSEQTGQKMKAPIMQAVAESKNALEQFFSSTAKRIASQEAEARTVGMSAAAHAQLKTQLEAEAIAKQNNIPLTDAYRERIAALGESAAAAAMKMQAANLTQEVMTPAEKYAQKLEFQNQLFAAGEISAQTYARAQAQAANDAGTSWDIAGASMAGSFRDISQSFGKENKAMATAAKVFGAIQATISMFTGAAKALELPFPANLAAMAAVLAKGASLVASIKGQSVPGFATGGMGFVGGVGGIDSKRVSFDASPGELVRIERPRYGQDDGSGSSSGAARTIRIEGMQPDSIMFGRQVIEAIKAAVGDGARVVIAPA